MKRGGSVYILTNYTRSVLYIGVTADLINRITQHKNKFFPGSFTAKYNCEFLVYYEHYMRIEEAIIREKQMKEWRRIWKEDLINKFNPNWVDLYDTLF
jgi:putative endonuclease